MHARTRSILLGGALLSVVTASALHAQEVQMTFTGIACPTATFMNCFDNGEAVPFKVTFDLNTASGQLTTQLDGGYLSELSATGLRERSHSNSSITGMSLSSCIQGTYSHSSF